MTTDNLESPEQIAANKERYFSEAKRMQTGVAFTMHKSNECEPKHLRVGINSAIAGTAAIASLLIAKGLITEGEYMKALADKMQEERESYEAKLGGSVTLGECGLGQT